MLGGFAIDCAPFYAPSNQRVPGSGNAGEVNEVKTLATSAPGETKTSDAGKNASKQTECPAISHAATDSSMGQCDGGMCKEEGHAAGKAV